MEGSGNSCYLFVPEPDSDIVKKKKVTVLRILNEYIAVKGELDDISSVVTVGSAYLQEGFRIKIVQVDPQNTTEVFDIAFDTSGEVK